MITRQVAEILSLGQGHSRDARAGFDTAGGARTPENLSGDGERATLEWRDPRGIRLRFLPAIDSQTAVPRRSGNKRPFLKLHGPSPVPHSD